MEKGVRRLIITFGVRAKRDGNSQSRGSGTLGPRRAGLQGPAQSIVKVEGRKMSSLSAQVRSRDHCNRDLCYRGHVMKHTIIEQLQRMFHNRRFPKYIIFLNFLSQALQQLRTSEFKPYVVFVKPAIQEKRKTPPMSPACEDTSSPLVSLLIISFLKA